MDSPPSKHGRDPAPGFLKGLQDWEMSLSDKDRKLKSQDKEKKFGVVGEDGRPVRKAPISDTSSTTRQYDYLRNYDAFKHLSSGFMTEESSPDAASEKELGNEYFKQKKFKEAIDCYSRSIALSPTAVAYANRAMAYLKIKRFQEAEDDCTEALNLDDRYIKAFSRRSTARKELGKLKESVEDAEFALRLEPHNQEIKKQYAEAKSLYEKKTLNKASEALRSSVQRVQTSGNSNLEVKGHVGGAQSASSSSQKIRAASVQEDRDKDCDGQFPAKPKAPMSVVEIESKIQVADASHEDAARRSSLENSKIRKKQSFPLHCQRPRSLQIQTSSQAHAHSPCDLLTLNTLGNHKKQELKPSVQELAARAASLAKVEAAKNITPPNSAYQFEVSWRGLAGDRTLQAHLLKVTSPVAIPQIFKNALSAPMLMDIIRCIATFFIEEMDLAVKYLENFVKVSRFDMIIMCLSSTDRADLHKIWDEVFCSNATPMEYAERLDKLRCRYCRRQ